MPAKTETAETQERVIEGGMLCRSAQLREPNEEKRTAELVFSTEEEVEQWFGVEILGHGSGEVDMTRFETGSAPLLMDHNWRDQVGVIESASIGTDRKGRAVVRFGKSARAEEVFQDVIDGIRLNVSVGYFVNRMELTEKSKDGVPAKYRVTEWQPYEVSLVAVPADINAGVGRDSEEKRKITIIEPKERSKTMPEGLNENRGASNPAPASPPPAVPAAVSDAELDRIRSEARTAESTRIRSIQKLAEVHGDDVSDIKGLAQRYIENGEPVSEFQAALLEEMAKGDDPKVRVADSDARIGLGDNEAGQFSIIRAVNSVIMGDNSLAPFEHEVMEATRKKFKERGFKGDIQIPVDVMMHRSREMGQRMYGRRDLSVGGAGTGAELVGTFHDAASFIDLLRGQTLVANLGARILSGLVGNLAIPRLNGGVTTYWVTEGSSVTESTPSTGNINMTPKTIGAFTDLTRRILLQSSPDVEAMTRDDMTRQLAIGIDGAAYNGSGAGGEPTGIINTTGVGAVDYGAGVVWADVVDLETAVDVDNALMGSLHYVTTPTLKGSMKQTEKASNTAQFIWENMPGVPGMGEVNGYPAHSTTIMPAAKLIFGNYNDLLIGEWGVLDIIVDRASLSTSGGVRLVSLQDVDIALRHPESFAYGYT